MIVNACQNVTKMSYTMLRGRLARLGQTIGMRHPIDSKIDWVFKALLGAEDNAGG